MFEGNSCTYSALSAATQRDRRAVQKGGLHAI